MKRIILIGISVLCMSISASAQTGTWSGKLELPGTSLQLVFHMDGDNPTMDSPDQGAEGIPVQIEKGPMGKTVIRIPSLGASYEGTWMIRQITGTFRQSGLSLPLTLTPGVKKPNRPQTPQGPFPYTSEEVSFANGDAVLKGTLTLPEGCSRSTTALVMVTGSGLQNRDEEIMEHKPFAVIADALARAGIATLRYDDRGFGESTGNIETATTLDFAEDALAGLKLLKERFENVGIIGHSEGGTIALMLASQGDADFIVSLAGMVVSGKETLVSQNRIGLIQSGFGEEDTDAYSRLFAEACDAMAEGLPVPSAGHWNFPDALKANYSLAVQQLATPYMKEFITLDMRKVLDKIDCPVMALNGTKDIQVEYSSNLNALKEGLPKNEAHRIEALADLNHLFQHCKTGSTAEYKEIEETFAPEAIELIICWISSLSEKTIKFASSKTYAG